MSFQNKGFWMPKDGGCLTDGEITYDSNSRIESKRPQQWFIDADEAGFLPNKKQTLEVPGSNSFAGISASSLSPWGSVSGFNSVPSQFTEQLFNTDATRSTDFDERNISSVSMGGLDMGRKVMDDPFGNNSSFGLSMSHSLEDPKSGINFGGIRKVKVSEVRDPENFMALSTGPSYTRESNGGISTAHGYGKVGDSGISMGLTYGREVENVVTVGDSYGRDGDNFMSMGQSFDKDPCSTMAMGHSFMADGSTLPITNSISGADCNIMPMVENFSKGDNNVISEGNISQGDNMISVSHTYKGDSSIPVTSNYNRVDGSPTVISSANNKCESHVLSMGHSFNKGDSNIISFGGYNDDDDANASGRLLCNYDLLMGQSSIQRADTLNQKNVTVSNANAAIVAAAQAVASGAESAFRKKEDSKSTKKTPPNNFPSNVRSLLSTGILDEVPVKYIAWSREKELRGIIKGSGYLCGCLSCNFSKVINAYEFERHAGSKTKHPNNHIYFENGKTIYGIVQELRNTPQNMLFEVIQTITGSPINQKSFRIWKESFWLQLGSFSAFMVKMNGINHNELCAVVFICRCRTLELLRD
ncbi:Potassium-transporting ATPase alpha chain 1 [Bienertia sinuspersici]